MAVPQAFDTLRFGSVRLDDLPSIGQSLKGAVLHPRFPGDVPPMILGSSVRSRVTKIDRRWHSSQESATVLPLDRSLARSASMGKRSSRCDRSNLEIRPGSPEWPAHWGFGQKALATGFRLSSKLRASKVTLDHY